LIKEAKDVGQASPTLKLKRRIHMSKRWFVGYMNIVTLLIGLSLMACQAMSATQNTAAEAAESGNEAANKALVQRFYDEVFTQKKMPVLDEIFDPKLAIHDLDVGGELPGGGLVETLAAFPDVKATVNLWVTEGELVTAYVTLNGTHRAEFLGVALTRKAVTWSIIDIWRVHDGKIIELWHNIPNEDILEQISD
jgi:predicted ester cyclase